MSDPPVAASAGPGSLPGFRTDIELFSVAGHDGIIREVNGRFERMLGLDAHAAEGRSLLEFVHPEDITRVVAGLSALESGTDEVLVENRFLAGDGSVVHLEWVARTAAGTDLWWAAARDVTAFHTAVAAGTDLRTRLHLAIGTGLAAMWDLDVRTGTLHWEEEAAELLGVDPEDVPGTVLALTALARPDEQGTLHAAFSLLPTGADGLDIEFAIGAEQSTRFVRLRGKVVERDRRGRGTRAIGLVVDMSAEKAMQEQMLVLLMSDPLTGVANRRAFDQTLRAQWRRCTRAGLPISMAMVDLDDFKRLNDTYGHLVGDDVLCAVVGRSARTLGPTSTCSAGSGARSSRSCCPRRTPESPPRSRPGWSTPCAACDSASCPTAGSPRRSAPRPGCPAIPRSSPRNSSGVPTRRSTRRRPLARTAPGTTSPCRQPATRLPQTRRTAERPAGRRTSPARGRRRAGRPGRPPVRSRCPRRAPVRRRSG